MRKQTTWTKTPTPGLLRHKTGRYYGRFTLGGKTTFEALKTDLLEIARTRFAKRKVEVESARRVARNTETGANTVGDLALLYRNKVKARVGIVSTALLGIFSFQCIG